jgi:hypothetical protein
VHVNEILEALDALGACTLATLATYVKIDKSNLLDLLKALVDAGILRRSTEGHIVTYSITAQPSVETQPPLLGGCSAAATATSSNVTTTRTMHTTPTMMASAPLPASSAGVPPGVVPRDQSLEGKSPHSNRPKPPKRKKR